jgi:LacI family transcriptional regulator
VRVPPRRRKIALLIESSNTYAREVLHGIRSWMRENERWSIRLSEHGRGADVPAWLRDWPGDGIIARVENDTIAAALRATGLPVVDVSAALRRVPFPRVVTDSDAVTRLAAEHLLERGFKHFGYCGQPGFLWSTQRAKYFAAHLRRAGHTCDAFNPPPNSSGSARPETEVRAIARWLEQIPKPAGVLACYDVRGQQVLEACQLAGLAVPEDVAVIGVHNDELLCDLCDPPLSSVIPNSRRTGHQAAALLARMIAGEHVPPEVHYVTPIGVAARQSTDVVAVADPKLSAAVRFIRERAQSNLTVGEVLRAVPMSRTVFERKFQQLLGQTPHAYMQRLRLAHVKTLLATTDLPIGTIAERCGFEHTEYLSVAFRRETGFSPRDYRAANASNRSQSGNESGGAR